MAKMTTSLTKQQFEKQVDDFVNTVVSTECDRGHTWLKSKYDAMLVRATNDVNDIEEDAKKADIKLNTDGWLESLRIYFDTVLLKHANGDQEKDDLKQLLKKSTPDTQFKTALLQWLNRLYQELQNIKTERDKLTLKLKPHLVTKLGKKGSPLMQCAINYTEECNDLPPLSTATTLVMVSYHSCDLPHRDQLPALRQSLLNRFDKLYESKK